MLKSIIIISILCLSLFSQPSFGQSKDTTKYTSGKYDGYDISRSNLLNLNGPEIVHDFKMRGGDSDGHSFAGLLLLKTLDGGIPSFPKMKGGDSDGHAFGISPNIFNLSGKAFSKMKGGDSDGHAFIYLSSLKSINGMGVTGTPKMQGGDSDGHTFVYLSSLKSLNGLEVTGFPIMQGGDSDGHAIAETPMLTVKGDNTIGYMKMIGGSYDGYVLNLTDTMNLNGVSGICPNSSYSYLTDVNGKTYQWQIDSGTGFIDIMSDNNYSHTDSNTLEINNIISKWSGYKYRCVVDGTRFSSVFTLRIISYWNGSINNQWEEPLNWNCGIIPDKYTDVYISPSKMKADNFPEINSEAECRCIRISKSMSCRVKTGSLTIYGH